MKITDEDLLNDVLEAYYEARKQKRNTRSQVSFEMNLEHNLVELYDELRQRTWKPSGCICFITVDPVKREVFASPFRDRVVHHLLFDYISPIFERLFIYDSYSCRKGKGTLKALERYEHHIRACSNNYTGNCYILQLDLKGYFMSIDKERLYEIISSDLERMRHRKGPYNMRWDDQVDFDFVDYLVREILAHSPTKNVLRVGEASDWKGLPSSKSLFCQPEGVGLPIGDLTSQLFSNIYLNRLDHYCKRELECRHYGRYVDDFYIMGRKKQPLLNLVPYIRKMLKDDLGVTLHPHKIHVTHYRKGTRFMGGYVLPHRRMLRRRTIWKFRREMNRLAALMGAPEVMSVGEVKAAMATINSYLGLLCHYDTYRIRRNAMMRAEMYRYFDFTPRFTKAIMKKEPADYETLKKIDYKSLCH